MNLITFTFWIDRNQEEDYITESEELKEFWDKNEVVVSLFRDTNEESKFYQIFLTEKNLEQITELIKNEEKAKRAFDLIKQAGGKVLVSSFEQIY
ncbi:hypothetical protein DRQ07_11605 [candidate division KSB1 bacterium]|nr:MAG: hypothetical protein DRQ07_11605 [candidate division KSB1 bacterium]